MNWGKDLLNSAVNSNVGQSLVTAGAERAAAEIYGRSGFGGEEVNSPTAKVEAPAPAPMHEAPKSKKKFPKWGFYAGGGMLLIGGLLLIGGKKKGK